MISVILPAYNREGTILRAVQSVLGQTYSDIELIVVDDGSTDGTGDIVTSIQDPRMKLLRTVTNQGACAARNLGVAAARGDWVAFQDSDDAWYPGKLERQLQAASTWGADVVFSAMRLVQENGKPAGVVPEPSFPPGICTYEKFLERSRASTQTIMGRRDCFLSEPFDEAMPRMQDWDIILRLARRYKICYAGEVLVDTYLQSDSLTMQTEKGLEAYRRIYAKNKSAIEGNPGIKAAHIALEGYLLTLSGKNAARFFWKNLSIRFGLKQNTNFAIKAILAVLGVLPKLVPPPGGWRDYRRNNGLN